MSKRRRRKFQLGQSQNRPVQTFASPTANPTVSGLNIHAAEYRIIRNDLIRVAVVNLIFLAAVLIVYFTNRQSNYLEQIYSRLF
jgi:hypothetical protein